MCRWRKIVAKIRCKGWAVDSLTQMRRKVTLTWAPIFSTRVRIVSA